MSEKRRDDLRNIAIIAHVDHGKTTLVNQLLKQSDTLPEHMNLEDRAMDSNAIERERGNRGSLGIAIIETWEGV